MATPGKEKARVGFLTACRIPPGNANPLHAQSERDTALYGRFFHGSDHHPVALQLDDSDRAACLHERAVGHHVQSIRRQTGPCRRAAAASRRCPDRPRAHGESKPKRGTRAPCPDRTGSPPHRFARRVAERQPVQDRQPAKVPTYYESKRRRPGTERTAPTKDHRADRETAPAGVACPRNRQTLGWPGSGWRTTARSPPTRRSPKPGNTSSSKAEKHKSRQKEDHLQPAGRAPQKAAPEEETEAESQRPGPPG
jgi:hypothetical protein